MKYLQVKLEDPLALRFKSWASMQGITTQDFLKNYIIDNLFNRTLLSALYTKVRSMIAFNLVSGEKVSLEGVMDKVIDTADGYSPFFNELSEQFLGLGEVLEFVENYCAKRNIPHMGNLVIEAKKNSQQGVFRKAFVLAYIYLKLTEEFGKGIEM